MNKEAIQKHLVRLAALNRAELTHHEIPMKTEDHVILSSTISDILFAALLSEMSEATSVRVLDKIDTMINIGLHTTDCTMAAHPRYVNNRINAIKPLISDLITNQK